MRTLPLPLSLLCTTVLALPQQQHSTESPYLVVEDTTTTNTKDDTSDDGKEDADVVSCEDVMANNGLNFSSFWHGAAHGIHSIYLEEIREFFEPDAPAINKIPVVNDDLSSEQIILFDAPLAGYDEDFKTMALKVMAYFMLNDKPDFATQGINTLEKLTHQYHMHEIYATAAPLYRKMKENPPKDTELCPCVNDITGNGILDEVVNIARQLKYFNSKRQPRARGDRPKCKPRPSASADRGTYIRGNYYRCTRRGKRSTDTVTKAMIAQYEQQYLANSTHENAEKLLDVSPWAMNSLLGPEQWISYEAMLTVSMLEAEELNDFVVFMYCKLNEPDLDHPKDLFD